MIYFRLLLDHTAKGHLHAIEMDIEILISCIIEGLLDIFRCFSADLEVRQTSLFDFGTNLLVIDLPLFAKIALITQQYHYCLFFLVVMAEIDPLVETIEGFDISDYSQPYW